MPSCGVWRAVGEAPRKVDVADRAPSCRSTNPRRKRDRIVVPIHPSNRTDSPMNIGNIIGFIAAAVAIYLAISGSWGWAAAVFFGGAALGAIVNMVIVAAMRGSMRDDDRR